MTWRKILFSVEIASPPLSAYRNEGEEKPVGFLLFPSFVILGFERGVGRGRREIERGRWNESEGFPLCNAVNRFPIINPFFPIKEPSRWIIRGNPSYYPSLLFYYKIFFHSLGMKRNRGWRKKSGIVQSKVHSSSNVVRFPASDRLDVAVKLFSYNCTIC